MCDPLTIGGIALSGLSAAVNANAQSQVQSARDEALAAERVRQQGLDREAAAINTRSQDRYSGYEQKQDDRAKSLGDYFSQQTSAPADQTGPVALPASGSNVTVQAENEARANARGYTQRTGEALGDLRSFGDLMGQIGRGTARDAGRISQIGGFKRGSSAVLPHELEAANSRGAGTRTIGDILGGFGRIGVAAGVSGASPFGFGAAPAVPTGLANTAAGRALDRASVPGYAGGNAYSISSLFGGR